MPPLRKFVQAAHMIAFRLYRIAVPPFVSLPSLRLPRLAVRRSPCSAHRSRPVCFQGANAATLRRPAARLFRAVTSCRDGFDQERGRKPASQSVPASVWVLPLARRWFCPRPLGSGTFPLLMVLLYTFFVYLSTLLYMFFVNIFIILFDNETINVYNSAGGVYLWMKSKMW